MTKYEFWRDRSVLVTGGMGFIGRHLVSQLVNANAAVRLLVRPGRAPEVARRWPGKAVTAVAGDLLDHPSFVNCCNNISTVFHLAGCSGGDETSRGPTDEMHWRVTVDGTRALLREAAGAGVRRFVFVSTVKAMGEGGGRCFDETSPLSPVSGYGRAKRAAEQFVVEAGKKQDLRVSMLRLPLVYGRDNQGNIPRMIAAIDRGRFPPLPELNNQRSMVHVDDVVQALLLAGEHRQAIGQVYIVTDGKTYSTSYIYSLICATLGKEPPAWRAPLWALQLGARAGDAIENIRGRPFLFNSDVLSKLTGSEWYNGEKIQRELGFRPTRTLADGLREMVAEYRRQKT